MSHRYLQPSSGAGEPPISPKIGSLTGQPSVSEAIHQAALDLLTRREHSRRELGRKLRRKGFEREAIESVLARLETVGLVSDTRYARLFVSDKLAVNPQGRHRLLRGLRAKGVEPELASNAVDQVFEERGLTERELATSVARKRLAVSSSLDPLVVRRRLAGYLARRGFSGATIAEVLRQLLGETSLPPEVQ